MDTKKLNKTNIIQENNLVKSKVKQPLCKKNYFFNKTNIYSFINLLDLNKEKTSLKLFKRKKTKSKQLSLSRNIGRIDNNQRSSCFIFTGKDSESSTIHLKEIYSHDFSLEANIARKHSRFAKTNHFISKNNFLENKLKDDPPLIESRNNKLNAKNTLNVILPVIYF